MTPVFLESKEVSKYFFKGYRLVGSPTLHSGQQVEARVSADSAATVALVFEVFDEEDELQQIKCDAINISAGDEAELSVRVPDTGGYPLANIGLEVSAGETVYLDWLRWHGTPEVTLKKVKGGMWHRAWVDGADRMLAWPHLPESFRLVQNKGTGVVLHGSREWRDYQVTADVTPHLVRRAGIVARVQGLKRHYSLTLDIGNKVSLTRSMDKEATLASADFSWELGRTYELKLEAKGNSIKGYVDGALLVKAVDDHLADGGIGLLIDEGTTATNAITVRPV